MKIDVEVSVELGAGLFLEAAEAGVRSRLEERFLSFTKGRTVFRSELLSAVQSAQGVVRAELVRPREDVQVPAGEAAVLGMLLVRV